MSRTFIREQPENRLAAREERDLARCERPERSRSRRARRLWFVLTGDLGRIVYATVPLRLIADADPSNGYEPWRVQQALRHLNRVSARRAEDPIECDQECCGSDGRTEVRIVDITSKNVELTEEFGGHVRGKIGGAFLLDGGIWIHPDCFFEIERVLEILWITRPIHAMAGTQHLEDQHPPV